MFDLHTGPLTRTFKWEVTSGTIGSSRVLTFHFLSLKYSSLPCWLLWFVFRIVVVQIWLGEHPVLEVGIPYPFSEDDLVQRNWKILAPN